MRPDNLANFLHHRRRPRPPPGPTRPPPPPRPRPPLAPPRAPVRERKRGSTRCRSFIRVTKSLYEEKIVKPSHNDYLEALAETGILGGLCCAGFSHLVQRGLKTIASAQRLLCRGLQLSGWCLQRLPRA